MFGRLIDSNLQRIFLRSFSMNRNLLLCKRKNRREAVCSKVKSVGELLNPVTGFTRPPLPKLFFQCSRSQASTKTSLNPIFSCTPVTNGCCQWRFVVSFRVGLKLIVTGQGAAVGLNGGSCIQSSLERTAFTELSVRRGMRNRGHNSGMTPVNRKAGTGERTRELPWGNARDLYSPVGFRHH